MNGVAFALQVGHRGSSIRPEMVSQCDESSETSVHANQHLHTKLVNEWIGSICPALRHAPFQNLSETGIATPKCITRKRLLQPLRGCALFSSIAALKLFGRSEVQGKATCMLPESAEVEASRSWREARCSWGDKPETTKSLLPKATCIPSTRPDTPEPGICLQLPASAARLAQPANWLEFQHRHLFLLCEVNATPQDSRAG